MGDGIDGAIGTDDGWSVRLAGRSGQSDARVSARDQVPAIEVAIFVVRVNDLTRDIDDGGVDALFVVVSERADQGFYFLHVRLAGQWIGL